MFSLTLQWFLLIKSKFTSQNLYPVTWINPFSNNPKTPNARLERKSRSQTQLKAKCLHFPRVPYSPVQFAATTNPLLPILHCPPSMLKCYIKSPYAANMHVRNISSAPTNELFQLRNTELRNNGKIIHGDTSPRKHETPLFKFFFLKSEKNCR